MNETTALPDPGEVPVLDWINVDLIGVEPLYQRPIDLSRVESIVRSFTWRSFGALVVVPQDGGRYNVTDGQHRLEAARQHPMVTFVPCVIVKADDVHAEAGIFVEINRNRKNVSGLELFFAQLTAGDSDAERLLQVCNSAGVRIPKHPGKDSKPNDCVSITTIQACIVKHGTTKTRQMLALLCKAQFSPIGANHIKAVEMLLTDEEFCTSITPEALEVTVRAEGVSSDVEARRFAETHRVPFWKGLANVWFQKTRKSRAPAGRVA